MKRYVLLACLTCLLNARPSQAQVRVIAPINFGSGGSFNSGFGGAFGFNGGFGGSFGSPYNSFAIPSSNYYQYSWGSPFGGYGYGGQSSIVNLPGFSAGERPRMRENAYPAVYVAGNVKPASYSPPETAGSPLVQGAVASVQTCSTCNAAVELTVLPARSRGHFLHH